MYTILADARFALRLLRRSPGFAVTLLGILIAGIGATTAMFSIAESLLLRPLPYVNPGELTMISSIQPQVDPSNVSIPDFRDWKAQATTFSKMAAIDNDSFSLASAGQRPEFLPGADVSGDYFSLLGLKAQVGRLLTPEDDVSGAAPVAVLAAAVWHRRFASDPGLVGRAITLNSRAYTVVGIAPEGFRFGGPSSSGCDVWLPLAPRGQDGPWGTSRGSHFLHVIGRRRPGATIDQAQAQLSEIARALEAQYPETNTKSGVRVMDLHEALVGSSRAGVWVLFAAVTLVFLIVCANVANLLLTRAQSRRAEMAARAALGATRSRLAGQLIVETVVVFLLGSAGGALVARSLVGVFAAGIIDHSAATIDLGLDWIALAFAVVTCTVSGLVFGLVPAVAASRIEPQAVLSETATRAGVSRSQRLVRGGLVVAQVAVAFALLAGSGLALRAYAKVSATPPGFDPENLVTARIALAATKYKEDAKTIAFYDNLVAKVAARPDVRAVAVNSTLPLAGSNSSGGMEVEGRPPWPRGDAPEVQRNVVTPGYFTTMGIPLLRGRDFNASDIDTTRKVLIISQAIATRFFPGEDPIGRRLDLQDSDEGEHVWREIVGVAGDVRRLGLGRDVAPETYVPLAQHAQWWMTLAVRTPHPDVLMHDLPAIVESVDPEQAVGARRLAVDLVAQSIGMQRYIALLLGAFAVAALLLSTLGIFGLVSYVTSQRTRELGIRMALGSTPEGVVRLVMNSGLRLLGAGLALGLVGALLAGRVMAGRVAGVSAFDLPVYSVIPVILGVAGILACVLPAWRAVRVPPAIALRYE